MVRLSVLALPSELEFKASCSHGAFFFVCGDDQQKGLSILEYRSKKRNAAKRSCRYCLGRGERRLIRDGPA
jgi:hypothetical protein